MITCAVRYTIGPRKIEAFERFGRRWTELVRARGGTHHGCFLPAEGASDGALALFGFPGLAAYEEYRRLFGRDPEFIEADRIRDESGCVLRHERTFMRPLLPGDLAAADTDTDSVPWPATGDPEEPPGAGDRGLPGPGR
ncbi:MULTISPECIES: NIPSNAP family protein [unclassified Streptomyces]|uniref:NIPSNAP family protein n=1 Tax=unclassified Streptomyces TaxID=2593676 RepID=UPI003826FADB